MNMRRSSIMARRIFKTGAVNFVRNAWLGMAAIAVMVITLTIILFSIIANATFSDTIATFTDRIDISVYLKDEVTPKQRDNLIGRVKNLENVKSVEYITKAKALQIFKEQNADTPELAQAATESDLPAGLKIKPRDPNRIESIRTFLEGQEVKQQQAKETSYSGDRKAAIDKITESTRFFKQAGIVGVVVFAIISMLIIFNTIQMAIFNRRDELTIMRLLGASTNYIRGPFIVESMLYGVVSGIASLFIIHGLFTISARAFEASSFGLLDISFSNQYFSDNYWKFLGLQLGIGVLIGTVSSLIATRRYLKFKSGR